MRNIAAALVVLAVALAAVGQTTYEAGTYGRDRAGTYGGDSYSSIGATFLGMAANTRIVDEGGAPFLFLKAKYSDAFSVSVWASIEEGPGANGNAEAWTSVAQDTTEALAAGYHRFTPDFGSLGWEVYEDDILHVTAYAYDSGGALDTLVQSFAIETIDATAPVIASSSASFNYGLNGDALGIEVDAEADEPALFDVTATLRTSYPLWDAEPSEYYSWKTAAVGDHMAASYSYSVTLDGLGFSVGPRVYNSDTLLVVVTATDASGNVSDPDTAYFDVLNVPIGDVPALAHNEYAHANYQSGGLTPNSGTIAEWSTSYFIIGSTDWLIGNETMDNAGYGQWIDAVRDYPGSVNKAFVAHGGEHCQEYTTSTFAKRKHEWASALYDSLHAAGSADTLAFVHDKYGNIADFYQNSSIWYSGPIVNFCNDFGVRRFAQFIVNEWNHADNRLPYTGFLFDVWEPYRGYNVYDPDDTEAPYSVINASLAYDGDQDGTVMYLDSDEQEAMRDGREIFFSYVRNLVAATSNDSAEDYFILGGNSDYAPSDAEYLATLDLIYIEDFSCPHYPNYYTSWGDDYPLHNALDPAYFDAVHPYDMMLDNIAAYPDPADSTVTFANFRTAMRDSSGGPFVLVERREDLYYSGAQEPNLVYSLLFDNFYPVYVDASAGASYRRFIDPATDGVADVTGLGAATAAAEIDSSSISGHWLVSRTYDNGTVSVGMPTRASFDCETTDMEYAVAIAGSGNVIESSGWDANYGSIDIVPPAIYPFSISSADSTAEDGNWRVSVAFNSDEAGTAIIRFASSIPGISAADTIHLGASIDEYSGPRDTRIALDDLNSGTIYASLTVTDASDNTSNAAAANLAVTREVEPDTTPPTLTAADSTYTEATELASINVTSDELFTPEWRYRVYDTSAADWAGAWSAYASGDTTTTNFLAYLDATALDELDYVRFGVTGDDAASNTADEVYADSVVDRVPSAPTIGTATPGDGQLVVTWTNPAIVDVDSASVYVGTGTGGPYTLFSSGLDVTAETVTVTGLSNGTSYYCVVTVTDASDQESDDSSEVSGTPAAASADGFVGTRLATVGNDGWGGTRFPYYSVFTADTTGTVSYAYMRRYATNQEFAYQRPVLWSSTGDTLAVGECGGTEITANLYRFTLNQPVSITQGTTYWCGLVSSDSSWQISVITGVGSYYTGTSGTSPYVDPLSSCPTLADFNPANYSDTMHEDTAGQLPVWFSNHAGEDGS